MSKVKICGLRRTEDIEIVNQVLPDYIGFVFAKSQRQINAETAAKLKEKLDPRILAVGVFVNQGIDYISELFQGGVIDIVQLHGDEDTAYIKHLRNQCPCPLIQAVGIRNSIPHFQQGADYILFDTASKQRGGSGNTFDWNMLKGYNDSPYFLAGGLHTENLEVALRHLSPFCLDVSSGVETNGFKDLKKVEKFVQLARRLT